MDWLIIRAVRFHIGWNSVGILLYQSGHCWYSSPISDMKFSNWQSLGGCNRCEMINLSNSSDQVHKSKEPLLTLASYRRNKVAHDIYILVPIISGKPICTIKHHFVQFLLNQLKDLKNARGHRKMRTCKILVQLVFPFEVLVWNLPSSGDILLIPNEQQHTLKCMGIFPVLANTK